VTEPVAAPPTEAALRELAAWEPRLADPAFSMGAWTDAATRADGVIEMPYFTLSEDGEAFTRAMAGAGLVRPFDWPAWLESPRGQELRQPAAAASASAEELANLLTAIVRSERFSEGSIEGAFESGLLLAIARRAGALVEGLA
jgi:hypothetical protein